MLSGIIFISLPGKTSAQADDPDRSIADTVFYFKGRVVDAQTRKPVLFAHVINKGRGSATICDTMGYFFLKASIMDTLQFTAIGYAPIRLLVSDSLRALRKLPDILIRSIRYSIEAVMINPLGNYQSFKSKVADLQLPPPKYTIHPKVLNEIKEETDILLIPQNASISPVTALYNWLSKEGKSKRRYRQLLEQEEFERQISYKYSPMIISGITGYNGFRLYNFMDFCSFKKKFLEESDRYEILDAVKAKQEIFEALEEPGH